MTTDELLSKITQSVRTAFEINRKTLPYGKRRYVDALGYAHPGNLANNAYRIKMISPTEFDIYIDDAIAPYASIINQSGYRTCGYWDNTVQQILNQIQSDLNGKFE